jgi:transposase InsO family protein
MIGLLARAGRRHGFPDALYLDNGSTYSGGTLRLACERLGVTLIHARPYSPQARGKMERFWLLRGGLDGGEAIRLNGGPPAGCRGWGGRDSGPPAG